MLKIINAEFDDILNGLRKAGHRITKARSAILLTLISAGKPLTAAQILADARVRAASREKTTVYRELDFLVAEKLAHTIDLQDGKRRFEITHRGEHHHHLVCTKCETVTCVELPKHLHDIEAALGKKHHFLITSHSLEFFGLCKSCQVIHA